LENNMGSFRISRPARAPRSRRWFAPLLVVALGAGALAVTEAPGGAATCAPIPASGQWLGTWTIDNFAGGGAVRTEYTVTGTTITGSLVFSTGQSVLAPGSAMTGSLNPTACTYTVASGPVTGKGVVSGNGLEMIGTWEYMNITGQVRVGFVNDTESGSGTVTTDPEADGVSPSDPVETTVVSPNPGTVTIDEATSNGGTLPGYAIVENIVRVTAPSASAASPLELTFDVDSSSLGGVPATSLTVFRNGVVVPQCLGAVPPITSDPCVSVLEPLAPPQSGARITVLTSEASVWAFGAPAGSLGLRVITESLPPATLGQPYSAALEARGTGFAVKWKRIGKLPKGLKLDPLTGVIQGVPRKTAGPFTFSVQVREVVKKTLRQTATRPLSIVVS
jgi:hypothetical protein